MKMISVARLSFAGALAMFATMSVAYSQVTQQYTQTNLVSDQAGVAANTDKNLVNPWGLSRSSGGPWWVSDNGSGLSTLYTGTGTVEGLVVTVPPAESKIATGSPTGTIFNGTNDFQIAAGKPALFLFVTEDGTISGWNPGVQAGSSVIVVNEKTKASYKGATIASVNSPFSGTANYLYAADFENARISVFDSRFKHVSYMENLFKDDQLPAGYAPFNVQNIGGNLYVAYAQQDSTRLNEVDGAGLGDVDVYSPEGKLLKRLEHTSGFNAPWGLVQASSDFGAYSHDILVGNFGSGEILAFNALTGKLDGRLKDASNNPIKIPGLWGLAFGNDASAGPATTLYFAAGIDNEQHGLIGSITAIQNTQGNDR